MSRRELFQSLGRKTASVTAAALPNLDEAKAADDPFHEKVRQHPENTKRSHLLEVVRALAGEESETRDISWSGAPFAAVEVNSDCVGCNVCETLCPVGALSRRQEAEAVPEATRTVDPARREEGGIFALEFNPALCTGCGVCEAACFPKAIRVRETWVPSALLGRRAHALIRARRQTCAACGGDFLGDQSGLCPFCLKPPAGRGSGAGSGQDGRPGPKVRQETMARRWASAENNHDQG